MLVNEENSESMYGRFDMAKFGVYAIAACGLDAYLCLTDP